MQKVTKRHAHIQVVELEFDGDATVPVYVPTILTKGSDPASHNDDSGNSRCKEEPLDCNPMDTICLVYKGFKLANSVRKDVRSLLWLWLW